MSVMNRLKKRPENRNEEFCVFVFYVVHPKRGEAGLGWLALQASFQNEKFQPTKIKKILPQWAVFFLGANMINESSLPAFHHVPFCLLVSSLCELISMTAPN